MAMYWVEMRGVKALRTPLITVISSAVKSVVGSFDAKVSQIAGSPEVSPLKTSVEVMVVEGPVPS